MDSRKVRKAVIPVAGFGTRFLPATKAVAKELFPIVDKPALSFLIDEAIGSGIEEILIVLSPQKGSVKSFFEENIDLNKTLLANNKMTEYALANPSNMPKISYVVQETMNGNAMAIMLAKEFADGEPFAVMFGDDVMFTGDKTPVTKQLIDAYQKTGKSIVGCQETSEEVARRCGVMILGDQVDQKIFDVNGIIEKPKGEIPSRLVSLGRFLLTADIFDEIENTPMASNGEYFLADTLGILASQGKVCACEFDAKRYDIGNKFGFLMANIEFGLRHGEVAQELGEYIKKLASELD